ncbi:MAG: tetratricopeptide repeat protein [candidate division WOR-3 bacterium]|nr:tetratricopeptide repeat protein [candidate division WOR-3 bacterium]
MPLEPTHTPKGDRPAAERQLASAAPVRQFVDREEFIAPVHAALQEPQRTKPLLLVYYGGAGIGKSRLRRELTKQMAGDHKVLTAVLDFDIPSYRQPETALFALRKAVSESYLVRFPSFDLACAVYWQKTHPDTAIAASGSPKAETRMTNDVTDLMLEPGSLLSQLPDDTGKLPLIGLVPRISSLVSASLDPSNPQPLDPFYSEWWERRGERELEDLPQMEPGAIVERLPMFWAADLKDYLRSGSRESGIGSSRTSNDSPLSTPHSRSAVLFIDTYEGLWETGSTEADFFKRDEWVRELVKQLPEVLWVICGRQKLRWEEVETDWGKALSQHQLGALPDRSARRFLESCDITNGQIQDAIVKGSQGVPHYLDLAVDAVQSARYKVQDAEFRGDSPKELVAQFTRQLGQPEVETLNVLSATRFWYYGLFENLMTKYQTGYPLTAYDDLSRFSFVSEGAAPGTRTMHQLMREALQESQSPELRKRVHLFLHELYAKQLEGLDVRSITERHRTALAEAFYHGRQAKSAEELWTWFEPASGVFGKAHQDRLLAPLFREVTQALETELGPDHLDTAAALFELATSHMCLGEYNEAEPLLRRALAIREKTLGPVHPETANALEKLALLSETQGRYAEAEPLYQRALATYEETLGPDNYNVALTLDNLATLLVGEGRYADAELLRRRSLAITEKVLGPEHSETSRVVGNLAVLLRDLGRYAEAEPLARRSLAIVEKTLGPEHPSMAYSLHALGRVLAQQSRYAEAEPLLQRALAILEKGLGPEHDAVAMGLDSLGILMEEQRRYAEAEPLYRRALAVREKTLGPEHPEVAVTLNNLSMVLLTFS